MSVKKLYNKDASSDNILQLHASASGCCETAQTFCKYTLTREITSCAGIKVEIDGVTTEFAFTSVSTAKEIRKSIALALKDAGYDPYVDDIFKSILVTGTEIVIIGEAKVTHIKIASTYYVVTATCTPVGVCKASGFVTVATAAVISLGAIDVTIDEADEADTITALEAIAISGVVFQKVETTGGDSGVYFTLHIENPANAPLMLLNGVQMTQSGCYPTFK